VPVALAEEGLDTEIVRLLQLNAGERDMSRARTAGPYPIRKANSHRRGWTKYVQLEDAYKSLRESLMHGGLAHKQRTVIEWVEPKKSILLHRGGAPGARRRNPGAGGFGKTRNSGKWPRNWNYARSHKIPFFGICLGSSARRLNNAECSSLSGGTAPNLTAASDRRDL